ncbi:hypothetical protein AB0K12_33585 [Nonomuraea sp. NPDC049419]
MNRTGTPPAWDERTTLTTLTTFPDDARATVHAECEGLAEEGARRCRRRR